MCDAQKETCPICMDDLKKTNISVTKCGHSFCLLCIIQHTKGDNRCPLCRATISEDNVQPLVNNQEQEDIDHRLIDTLLRRRLINICRYIATRHDYEEIVRLSNMIEEYDSNRYNIDMELYMGMLINPVRVERRPTLPNPAPRVRAPHPPPSQVPQAQQQPVQQHVLVQGLVGRVVQRQSITRRCGLCRQIGHYRQTCPARII
jgi:hypothetical protein